MDYQLPLLGQAPSPPLSQVRVTLPSAARLTVNVVPDFALAATEKVVAVPVAESRVDPVRVFST
ncbi:MAG: hypothetical protein ACR2NH_00845, partial [Solirubrobacteraceae bacterium]